MAELARLPRKNRSAVADANHEPVPRLRTRYYAFLSYSHEDKRLADWLHRELERFRVPNALAGKLTGNGVVPRRLSPIFRDQQDLSAGADLGEEIKAAIAGSQFLIVLCSPTAAKSRWTNQEIESFKRTRPEGCVLAAVVAGEPFASDLPGRENEECFPPALRFKYDRRGHQTAKRAEPLAADFRESGEGKRLAFLKLVAGMLGVGLDELVQRDTTRRHRQLAWLAAASIGGMAVTSTLAVTAIQARDEARDQRRQAEGLVAFMLGDLKDKLEPIGRLDALDGVGARVLAYYHKQDTSELSDAALLQRSQALSLMANVAYQRGDMNVAERLYDEAIAGTAEAIRRNPNDPERLFQHAQNYFYLGEIARQRGDPSRAEAAYREYKRLAEQMVALDPNNMKWRVEEQSAGADLGIILFAQRRFNAAVEQFQQALATIEGLARADPANSDYQTSVADTLAWLADSQMSAGELGQATETRRQQIVLLNRLLARSRGDVAFQQRLIPAHRGLGSLLAVQGQRDAGIGELREAATNGDQMVRLEPGNRQWLDLTASAHLNVGEQLLGDGRSGDAATEINTGCGLADRLIKSNATLAHWRVAQRYCMLLRAKLALQTAGKDQAVRLAQQAVALAQSVHTNEAAADRHAVAKAYRLLGDAEQAAGDAAGARVSWQAAEAALPKGVAERPGEMNEHAVILERLGRDQDAVPLRQNLARIGYRT